MPGFKIANGGLRKIYGWKSKHFTKFNFLNPLLNPKNLLNSAQNIHLINSESLDVTDSLFVSGVNLLLAIVLFSTIVGEMLPVTNNTPLIGQNT